MEIKHVGHIGAVYVPALDTDVEPGEVIDVRDDALALSLLEQSENWRAVKSPAAPAPARKGKA